MTVLEGRFIICHTRNSNNRRSNGAGRVGECWIVVNLTAMEMGKILQMKVSSKEGLLSNTLLEHILKYYPQEIENFKKEENFTNETSIKGSTQNRPGDKETLKNDRRA